MKIPAALKNFGGLVLHGGLNCLVCSGTITGLSPLLSGLANAITGNIASNHFAALNNAGFQQLSARLKSNHPGTINHDLERLFKRSAVISLEFMKALFLAELKEEASFQFEFSAKEKKEFTKGLERFFDESISTLREDMKLQSIDKELINKPAPFLAEITDYLLGVTSIEFDPDTKTKLRNFYIARLPYCFELAFKEALKYDDPGFKAFQLWTLEEMQKQYAQLNEGQEKILQAITGIQQNTPSFSPTQLDTLLDSYTTHIHLLLGQELKNITTTLQHLSAMIAIHFDELYQLNTAHFNLSKEIDTRTRDMMSVLNKAFIVKEEKMLDPTTRHLMSGIGMIRGMAGSLSYSVACNELKLLNTYIFNSQLNHAISVCSAQSALLRQQEEAGIDITTQRQLLINDILNLTDQVEEYVRHLEPPENSLTVAAFSDESVLKILNLFNKSSKEKKLDEKELADVMDTRVKLQELIFSKFDKDLETIYKEDMPGVLFDRIIAFLQIQKPDAENIHAIRNNKNFHKGDRSLIVSGITVSLLNKFDAAKVHLLIDFLTDFEDEVWQKALAGVILSLCRYDNRLKLFPDIERRLAELKTIQAVQEGIVYIDEILRYRLFSNRQVHKDNPGIFSRKMQLLLGDEVFISAEDASFMQQLATKTNRNTEEEICMSLFNKEAFDDFFIKVGKEGGNISTREFIQMLNIDKYLEFNELNPLFFNLNTEFYTKSRNWFIPFTGNEKVRNALANDFTVHDIEVTDFLETLEQYNGFDNIDKYSIALNMSSYTEDFVRCVYYSMDFSNTLFQQTPGSSPLHTALLRSIKEIYRFQQLGINAAASNIFGDQIDIYNKTLLEKVAAKSVSDKIRARVLYEKREFRQSLEILLQSPGYEKDLAMLAMVVNNHYYLDEDAEMEAKVPALLALLEQDPLGSTTKNFWYGNLWRLYSRLNQPEKMSIFHLKEIEGRKRYYEQLLTKQHVADDLSEQLYELADAYFEYAIFHWNQNHDIQASLFITIQSFYTLFQIPDLPEELFAKFLKANRERCLKSMSLLFENDEYAAISERLALEIEALGDEPIILHFSSFLELIAELKQLAAGQTILKDNDPDHPTVSHIRTTATRMVPIFNNIKAQQPHIENVVVPFEWNKKAMNVLLPLEQFVADPENMLCSELIIQYTRAYSQNICAEFFDNLYLVTPDDFIEAKQQWQTEIAELLAMAMIPTDTNTTGNEQTLPSTEPEQ